MTYGITANGFIRKTFQQAKDSLATRWKETISPKLNFKSEKSIANQLATSIASDHAELWELGEAAWNASDASNATEAAAKNQAALIGLSPRAATYGFVVQNLTLKSGFTFAPGSVRFYVENEPANTWALNETVVTSGGVDAVYPAEFKSEATGSRARAPAGTLIKLVASVEGVVSGTNPLDSDDGKDEETPEELLARRDLELARLGSGTKDAIRADVAAVSGVQQVVGFTNRLGYPVGGVPARSHRFVIYDGDTPQASNNAIATAIGRSQSDGIASFGALSGICTYLDGSTSTEHFDRSMTTDLYCVIVVKGTITSADLKAAAAEAVTGVMGEKLVYSKLYSTLAGLAQVTELTTLYVGTAPSPTGVVNLISDPDERFRLTTTNVTVTINAP